MALTALLSYQVWRGERVDDGRYFTPAIVITGHFGAPVVHKIEVFYWTLNVYKVSIFHLYDTPTFPLDFQEYPGDPINQNMPKLSISDAFIVSRKLDQYQNLCFLTLVSS